MENANRQPVGHLDSRGRHPLTAAAILPSAAAAPPLGPGAGEAETPRRKALVMGDDTRGFLATVRSLGRQGIEVHAAPFDFRAPALSSRYLRTVHDVPPWMGDGSAWLGAMDALLRAERFDLVVPCDERNLLPLHRNRARLEPFATLAIPNARSIDVLFDKHETRLVAESVGVPIARGRLARADDEAGAVLAEFGHPVVVKPRRSYTIDGLAKRGRVHVTDDTEQLTQLLAEAESDSLLLESCFEGEGLGLSVLAHRGRLLQAFEHHRVHERSGSSFYRVSAPPTPDLVEACGAIAGAIEFTGVAMFEFKRNPEGGWIMLEVNARPWGSLPLPVALGVDFPFRWFRLLVDGAETPPVPYRVGVFGRNLIPDLMSALAEAESHPSSLRKAGSLAHRLAGTRRMLLDAEKQDVYVRDDPAPARAEFAHIVRNSLNRLQRVTPGRQRVSTSRAEAVVAAVAAQERPHILFACQGNICRSPYAEAVLRAVAGGRAAVSSAGMMPRPGRPMPDLFQARAAMEGLDMAAHRSTWLDRDSASAASLIVLFDRVNQAAFADRYPGLGVPTILLGDLIGVGEIDDPVDGDETVAAHSYRVIRRGVERLAALLGGPADPAPLS